MANKITYKKFHKDLSFAEFWERQFGHKEKYTPIDEGGKVLQADPISISIRHWIQEKIESGMSLRWSEVCNIEDIGSKRVFVRYIVDLHHLEQEVFIQFFITRHGVEINFLIWDENDPEGEGDPVRSWGFESDDDATTMGMARMHLRLLEGSRKFDDIMNLYK